MHTELIINTGTKYLYLSTVHKLHGIKIVNQVPFI